MTSVAVLLPVKAFSRAKLRLAPALGPAARASLARRLADTVLAAARPLPCAVVCDDAEVAAWAAGADADVVWTPGLGLDGAVQVGVAHLAAEGMDRVVVAHADLALVRPGDLAAVGTGDGVTLVPDRHGDGTNVAVVPAGAGFRFAYGPGSFDRHRLEARRLGLALDIRHVPSLAWDVDLPADLDPPGTADGAPHDDERTTTRCR